MQKHKLKEGDKFNKLTALKYNGHREGISGKVSQWLFKCDCGKECIKDDVNVRRGHTKSCSRTCGIYLGKNISLENGLYSKYKREALKRNLEFKLTKDELISLSKRNCNYCNIEPLQKYYKKTNSDKLLYNGIDRVNNEKGYLLENCVPCCIKCNTAKNNLSLEEFKSLISKIYNTFNYAI